MIAVPQEIKRLQQRYRSTGSLSASEVETLLNWQIQSLASQEQAAKEEGQLATLAMDDLVEFVMPRTVQGGAYTINHPFQGKCQAPYAVFLELARMREQDILGLQELNQRRGEAALGTGLRDYIEFTVPALTCRLVKRAAEIAKEAQRAAAA